MRIEEVVAAGICVSLFIYLVALDSSFLSFFTATKAAFVYMAFGLPNLDVFYWLGLFMYIIIALAILRTLFGYLAVNKESKYAKSTQVDREKLKKTIFDIVRMVAVLSFTIIPSAALLTTLSVTLRYQAKDLLLWKIDELLLGSQPFLFLTSVIYEDWMVYVVWIAYASLGYLLTFLLLFTFVVSRDYLFRIMLIAPIIGIFVAWPIYIHFPSLDPGNYFIRNFNQVQFPEEISSEIEAKYKPSPMLERFSERVRFFETITYNGSGVPISCFPSMHAVWGTICVFVLSLYNRRFLIPSVFWLILSLLGGLMTAQHYFVDYVLGVPIALLVLWFTSYLLKKDNAVFDIESEKVSAKFKEVFLP